MTGAAATADGGRAGAPDAIAGTPAAPGSAVGRLVVERARQAATGPVGTVAEERARLAAALAAARGELGALAERTDDALAGEVVGFQLALLEDPELVAPGEPKLVAGEGAAAAWRAGIGELIADYEAADDDYFRARAGDMRDLELRVLRLLAGASAAETTAADDEAIVLATDELTPSRFLELDTARVKGIASAAGAPTSHVAMLARARGVPLIVELSPGLDALGDRPPAGPVVLEADAGRLWLAPAPATLEAARAAMAARDADEAAARAHAGEPAATADGTPVKVLVNAEDPDALAGLDPASADGIGLTRTEFLFRDGPADEETQYAAYRRLVDWAAGRPVTIRTLDAGGDKPVPGVTPDGESNPFLGQRGLRLSLARPEAFRTQLAAILRAAAHGPVRIMLPMVTRPDELSAARRILEAVRADLGDRGLAAGPAELGIMVETPAAALEAAAFDADFYSIGTNDLVQYVMAAARDVPAVAHLHDPLAPAVLRLVDEVVRAGAARGAAVSVCGEAASLPEVIPALLDRGVRVLSVPPAAVGRTKRAVAAHRLAG